MNNDISRELKRILNTSVTMDIPEGATNEELGFDIEIAKRAVEQINRKRAQQKEE